MHANTLTPLVAALLLLSGCVPMMESYYRLDRHDAKYFGGSCNGNVGAPSGVYFPFNGIYLSASVNEVPRQILVGVHVPEAHEAQLLERTIRVSLVAGGKTDEEIISIQPTRLRGGNPDPREFRVTTDPFGREDYFGILRGETRTVKLLFGSELVGHKTYRFQAELRAQPEAGSITFPPIRIDGVVYQGPRLPFKKDSHFGVMPINC